ncbi:MAG: histidine kinase, partial [Arenimonas sp.]
MENTDMRAERVETLARLLVPALVAGLALAGIELAAMFDEPPQFSWFGIGLYIVNIYLVAEAIRWISQYLDRHLTWQKAGVLRAFTQLGLSLIFTCIYLLLVYVPMKMYEISQGSHDVLGWPHIVFTLLLALMFGTALGLFQLLFDFFRQWRIAQVKAEQQRLAVTRAELDTLKAQIKPHFLFNSFNAVYGLIEQDPARARSVLLELSDIFRYVLLHNDSDLVALPEELAFLDAYLKVLQVRHGSGLQLTVMNCEGMNKLGIPPMTLQLLLENVVCHNDIEI